MKNRGCLRNAAFDSECTIFGASFPRKKSLFSAQNIENKRPDILLPRRSMVLKVVRGKILGTLELEWFLGHPRIRLILAPKTGAPR